MRLKQLSLDDLRFYTDNDDYLYNHSAKCPGDIVLEIWRVAVGHSVKKWKAQDIVTNPGVIHETSKKAGAHATKYVMTGNSTKQLLRALVKARLIAGFQDNMATH